MIRKKIASADSLMYQCYRRPRLFIARRPRIYARRRATSVEFVLACFNLSSQLPTPPSFRSLLKGQCTEYKHRTGCDDEIFRPDKNRSDRNSRNLGFVVAGLVARRAYRRFSEFPASEFPASEFPFSLSKFSRHRTEKYTRPAPVPSINETRDS